MSVERYGRHLQAIDGEPLPCAYVDLDAFDANVRRVVDKVRAADKKLRPATKSVRVPDLLKRVAEIGGETVRGLMTYTARETAWLAEQGFTDLLLGYPTVQKSDAVALARAAKRTTVRAVCDAREQAESIGAAAVAEGTEVGMVVEVDLAFRPMGARLHLGVRRSPLRSPEDVAAFADTISRIRGVRFAGVMGYEAHIAGVSDEELGKRLLRRMARRAVEETRESITRVLRARGHVVEIFNGGGSGSIEWTAAEEAITEVTAGSAFLDSHLFDRYRDLPLIPAAHFALQVVRRPTVGIVACAGGGYIASGAMGTDRLPVVAFPRGARLLPMEGAGEVQTPIALAQGDNLSLGSAVILRHAKAGELAEHFDEYLLIEGTEQRGRARTYRGLGLNFLG